MLTKSESLSVSEISQKNEWGYTYAEAVCLLGAARNGCDGYAMEGYEAVVACAKGVTVPASVSKSGAKVHEFVVALFVDVNYHDIAKLIDGKKWKKARDAISEIYGIGRAK